MIGSLKGHYKHDDLKKYFSLDPTYFRSTSHYDRSQCVSYLQDLARFYGTPKLKAMKDFKSHPKYTEHLESRKHVLKFVNSTLGSI